VTSEATQHTTYYSLQCRISVVEGRQLDAKMDTSPHTRRPRILWARIGWTCGFAVEDSSPNALSFLPFFSPYSTKRTYTYQGHSTNVNNNNKSRQSWLTVEQINAILNIIFCTEEASCLPCWMVGKIVCITSSLELFVFDDVFEELCSKIEHIDTIK
jgi:hypothetical protein